MKWLLSLLFVFGATGAFAQQSFEPVQPTGKPYNVIVSNATLNGEDLTTGDSIAVLDGNTVVGAAEYKGSLPLVITTWEGDSEQNLEGFTAGNPMTIKIKSSIYDSLLVYEPQTSYQEGDGTFGNGAYTSVNLSYSTNFQPDISVSETQLDFGEVRIGQSQTRQLTLTNTGNAPLTLYSFSLGNPQLQVGQYQNTLDENESQTVEVTYSPSEAKPLASTLKINTNDPGEPEVTLTASAQGLPAQAPVLSLEPSSLDFGNVELGDSVSTISKIYNRGNDTLRINSINSSNPNQLRLELNKSSIPSGEYASLDITMEAVQVGNQSANIEIRSNSNENSYETYTASLVGYEGYFASPENTGLPYSILVEDIQIDNQHPPVGSEIAFYANGDIVGLGVVNGNYPLSVTAWKANTEQGLSGFSEGDSIRVTIMSEMYGGQIETDMELDIKQGDGTYGSGNLSVLSMNGITGQAPLVELERSPLIFDDIPSGYTDTLKKWVYNAGVENLRIESWNTSGAYSVLEIGKNTIASGDSTYIEVEFNPVTTGINEGNLTLSTNDPFQESKSISLRGRGLIEVPEDRVVRTAPSDPWLESKVGVTKEVKIEVENQYSRSEEINLSLEPSIGSVSLKQASLSLPPNGKGTIDLELSADSVGADSLNLVLTFQDQREQKLQIRHLAYKDHFEEVEPTGMPYTIVTSLEESGHPYEIGDQIAVYDGDQIVGAHRWKGSNQNIPITVWKANESNNLPGYSEGNNIEFRIYKNVRGRNGRVEIPVHDSTFSGSGTFGEGSYQEADIEADEPVYFHETKGPVKYRENQFSATTYASLDTLVTDPNSQSISHTFSSDTSALTASKFSNFYRLSMDQEFYGEVQIAHTAETGTSSATDTTTFVIGDQPVLQASDTLDLFINEPDTIPLYSVEMPRNLTHSYDLLNSGYANLNIQNDSLIIEPLKEGRFYFDISVTDEFGFDLSERITVNSRRPKPWISVEQDTLDLGTIRKGMSAEGAITLDHLLDLERTYEVEIAEDSSFSSSSAKITLPADGQSELELVYGSGQVGADTGRVDLIYEGFETDSVYSFYLIGKTDTIGQTVAPDSLSFDQVAITERDTSEFIFKNEGTVPVLLDSVKVDTPFEVMTSEADTVNAGDSVSVKVVFEPTEQILYESYVQFWDSGQLINQVKVRGAGIGPELQFSTAELKFGEVEEGDTLVKSIQMENAGRAPLHIDSVVSKSGSKIFTMMDTSALTITIDPDSSYTLDIGFFPPEAGSFSDTIRVHSENHKVESFTVSGDGDIGEIIYGDVDSNGKIQAYDAGLILRYSVGDVGLDEQALANADVSLDSTVSSYDASLILRYGVGKRDSLPLDTTESSKAPAGLLSMNSPISLNPGDTYELDVQVSEAYGIQSFSGELSYDSNALNIDTVQVQPILDNSMSAQSKAVDKGRLRVAQAGTELADSTGKAVILRIQLAEDFEGDSTVIKWENWQWNEGTEANMAKAVVYNKQSVSIGQRNDNVPDSYQLKANYPNPFNPTTQIRYSIPERSNVTLEVYSALGQRVKTLVNESQSAGRYQVTFNADNLSSGTYFYRLRAGEFTDIGQMMFVK